MAKITLTLEDDFIDGKQVVKGKFDTEGAPEPMNGVPAMETPAMLLGKCISRLWDCGAVNALMRPMVPDLLYRNQMIEQQRAAQLAKDEEVTKTALTQKADVEDAIVVQPTALAPSLPEEINGVV